MHLSLPVACSGSLPEFVSSHGPSIEVIGLVVCTMAWLVAWTAVVLVKRDQLCGFFWTVGLLVSWSVDLGAYPLHFDGSWTPPDYWGAEDIALGNVMITPNIWTDGCREGGLLFNWWV